MIYISEHLFRCQRRKWENKDKILVLNYIMRSALHYQIEGNGMTVGSTLYMCRRICSAMNPAVSLRPPFLGVKGPSA